MTGSVTAQRAGEACPLAPGPCGAIWVGSGPSWSPRDLLRGRGAGREEGVLTAIEGRRVEAGCPHTPQLRASRYETPRPPGSAGTAITLSTEAELKWAMRRWLMLLLAFDRAEGCWVLLEPDEDRASLTVGEIYEELTDPLAAEAAQEAVAEELADEARLGEIRMCELSECPTPVQFRVTEWRAVWHAGHRGYAPLFAGSQACHIPVTDLDPATGSACFCRKRAGAVTDG